MNPATCHPERKRYSFGQCRRCYDARYHRERRLVDPVYRAKHTESSRKWRLENPRTREQERDDRLRHRYGMTTADYDTMYIKQSGCCAICGEFSLKLSIDHIHGTKTVRQLLCHGCNAAIGLLKEDPIRIIAAAAYVIDHLA